MKSYRQRLSYYLEEAGSEPRSPRLQSRGYVQRIRKGDGHRRHQVGQTHTWRNRGRHRLPRFLPSARGPGLTRSGPPRSEDAAAARGHQLPDGDWQGRGRHDRRHLPATWAGSGSVANLVRRRTGPGGEQLPARQLDLGGSEQGRAAAMASAAVESFVAKQLDLLELERDAEVEERRYGRRPVRSGRSGSSPSPICSDPGEPSGGPGLLLRWERRQLPGRPCRFWTLGKPLHVAT